MDSEKDRLQAAIEAEKAPTQKRMLEDRAKIPVPSLKEVFVYMMDNLCEDWLSVKQVKKKLTIGDNSLSTHFKAYLGRPLWNYMLRRRMEIADRLLRNLNLEVGEAGKEIGMPVVESFSKAYERWSGMQPSDVQGKRLAPEAEAEPVAPPSMLDGPEWERWCAAGLWQEIRELPFERQRSAVGWHAFRTPALFDQLRRSSRQEGRKDRRRGIRLAELALHSLGPCAEAWSDRGYDLRARGSTELGNARRLASDLPAADAELEAAWAEWRTPRENPDPLVGAEICLHQGTLRMFQRRYDEALELFDEGLPVFEAEGDTRGQIEILIQRAAAHGYANRLDAAHCDLEEVSALTDKTKDAFFDFAVRYNLANIKMRSGKFHEALHAHNELKSTCKDLDHPAARFQIQHLEGNIKEGLGDYIRAEKLYTESHRGFVELEESRGAAFAGLDLAIVQWRRGKHERVVGLVSELIPILESLKLHPESLAAVRLLAEALAQMEVTRALLCKVREQLLQDPLVQLS